MSFQVSYNSIDDWKRAVYSGQGTVYASAFQRVLDDEEVRGYQLSYVEADKHLIHLFVDVVIKYSPDGSLRMIKLEELNKQAWEIVKDWLNKQNMAYCEASVYLPDLSKIIKWEEIGKRPDFYVYDPVEIKITQA